MYRNLRLPLLSLLLLFLGVPPSQAILFYSTGDPSFNATPPTGTWQDSGWDFEGQWGTKIGTPISDRCFVTAAHVGGSVGDRFVLNGINYVTDGVNLDPNGDLAIWHVTTKLQTWAPLYRRSDEVGKNLVVFGRGTQRGGLVNVNGGVRGFYWGDGDAVQRWGTNVVSAIVEGPPDEGSLIAAEFNLFASNTEADLSVGDSGGGVFIQDSDGIWKLAGINIDVDGYYAWNASGTLLNSTWPGLASLFDQSGLFTDGYTGVFTPASGPGRWYATRISSRAALLDSLCPSTPTQCINGIDDDGDGRIDMADGECASRADNREATSCGLGAEIALIVPILSGLRRRTMRFDS